MNKKKKFLISICFFVIAATGALLYFFSPKEPTKNITQQDIKKLSHSIQHLAIMMDGNRRWAEKQGLARLDGHSHGIAPLKTTVRFCIDQNIPYLSLYAFSLENFKRSPEELKHIFNLVKAGLTIEEMKEVIEKGVCIKFIGDRSRIPAELMPTITTLEEKTKNGTALRLNILFCYGGQQEITASMQAISEKISRGELRPSDITPQIIEAHLWMKGVPPPDLVVRTSGEQRLSNFLSWECAYSELLFIEKYWPAITYDDLIKMVETFEQRKRRFGT